MIELYGIGEGGIVDDFQEYDSYGEGTYLSKGVKYGTSLYNALPTSHKIDIW